MAMTIADVRAKYPMYADIGDQALADALHTKYYKDMDRREFDARIGLKPYDNVAELAGKVGQNLGPTITGSLQTTAVMGAEGVKDILTGPQMDPGVEQALGADGQPLPIVDNPASRAARAVVGSIPGAEENIRAGAESVIQDQSRKRAVNDLKTQLNAPDVAPNSVEDVAYQTMMAGADMTAPMLASIALRNPSPMVAYGSMRSSADGYKKARDAGLDPSKARLAAGLYAAAEAIPEAIGTGKLLEGGKTLVGAVLKGMASEGATEALTEALQAAVDTGVIGENITLDEAAKRLAMAGGVGAILGAPFAAVSHGVHGANGATTAAEVSTDVLGNPAPVVNPDEAASVEDQLRLPAPDTLLALPSPEQFKPADTPRRNPAPADTGIAAAVEQTPTQQDADYQARVATQKTRQAETAALLQTARETVSPLGSFTHTDLPGPVVQRVNTWRAQTGKDIEAPITIEDMARAKVSQTAINNAVAQKRPMAAGTVLKPADVTAIADTKNIVSTDGAFKELALRTTGTRDITRMTQTQLNAMLTTLEAMPAHDSRVTLPIADASPFTDGQYNKALDAIRTQGRFTLSAIKDATGLKTDKDAHAVRDAMVRRGQLTQRGKNDFRLYDVAGQERQTTPADVPQGAFSEHVVKRLPVNRISVKVNGKSVGNFGSATEARTKIRDLRAAETEKGGPQAKIELSQGEEVAYGVMENRYDAQGNLLGQVVVDTSRDERAARKLAEQRNNPTAPPVFETVEPTGIAAAPEAPKPTVAAKRVPPAALEGRVDEVLAGLSKLAKQRALPMLGVKVTVTDSMTAPDGGRVEGAYMRNLINIAAANIDPNMNNDQVIDRLAQVMDHELIHALKAAGILGPETAGWKSILRYARKATRPGSSETYMEHAKRLYENKGIPGYNTIADIEEEAIAEAFRAWAANRRSVTGQPASVFRQLVEWFKHLFNAIPEDVFVSIETGQMVRDALTPPGADMPRARAAEAMTTAREEIQTAQAARDKNAAVVASRSFLRARDQAREDRLGKSGPKTVLGTTPSKSYVAADAPSREGVDAIVQKYREKSGISTSGLATMLPEDIGYSMRVADAQQKGVHNPKANDVAKAYRALTTETRAMFDNLGITKVINWTEDGAPYASAADMMSDIENGRVQMRLSDEMFGPGADNPDHPMNTASGLKATDGTPATFNDMLRVVHDVYGRAPIGLKGTTGRNDYNAYHEHARLLSPEARRALATETLAQSAWHHYGPHLRRPDGTVPRERDVDYLPPERKEFAEQKAFLLPEDLVSADPGFALADEAAAAVEAVPKFSLNDNSAPVKRIRQATSPRIIVLEKEAEAAEAAVKRVQNDLARQFSGDLPEENYAAFAQLQKRAAQAQANVVQAKLAGVLPAQYSTEQRNMGVSLEGSPDDGHNIVVRIYDAAGDMVGSLRPYDLTFDNPGLQNIARLLTGAEPSLMQDIERRSKNLKTTKVGTSLTLGGDTVKFSLAPPTDSPAFKRWFGDSKVVNSDGSPQVVYHGTNEDFTEFSLDRLGEATGAPSAHMGFFFATNPSVASSYADTSSSYDRHPVIRFLQTLTKGGYAKANEALVNRFGKTGYDNQSANVMPVYVQLQNPLVVDFKGSEYRERSYADALIEATRINSPYDGVIFTNTFDEGFMDGGDQMTDVVVAFDPMQIKSATGNRGTFDPGNADIRYSRFDDELPGGRLYGNPNRSPGGAFSKPDTASPAFTAERDGNKFFGGDMADEQLRMAREGVDGTTMLYLTPDEFLALADPTVNPEQDVYDAISDEGFKLNTLPSLIIDGYAGRVRVTGSDGRAGVFSVSNRAKHIPVTVYTKSKESPGLVTAMEANGNRVAWPSVGRSENFPDARDEPPSYSLNGAFGYRVPKYSIGDDGFDPSAVPGAQFTRRGAEFARVQRGDRAERKPGSLAPTEAPRPNLNILDQAQDNGISRLLHNIGRSKAQVPGWMMNKKTRDMLGDSIFDFRIKNFDDRMLSVKDMMENMRKFGHVAGDANPYVEEQLASGITVHEIVHREDTLYKPLIEKIRAADSGKTPLTGQMIEDGLYALHAPEANAFLRARGSKLPAPSGMTDAESAAVLDKLALDGNYERFLDIATDVQGLIKDTNVTRHKGHLISDEVFNTANFEWYVPLRGTRIEDLDPEEVSAQAIKARSGKGYSVGGKEDRSRAGRETRAVDLVANAIMQNTESVIRAEKNHVTLSLGRLISDNPELGYGKIVAVAPTTRTMGSDGIVRERVNPSYRQKEDIVIAKYQGKEIVMQMADVRVARAMNAPYVRQSNAIVDAMGKMNRYLAAVNTSFNPEFIVRNLIKDTIATSILGAQYNIKSFSRNVVKNMPSAMNGIHAVLREGTKDRVFLRNSQKVWGGGKDTAKWAEAFQELQNAGGTTEFMGLRDLETIAKQLKQSASNGKVDTTLRQAREHMGKFFDFVDEYNKVTENALRLSAYVSAREAGASVKDAAYLAKNLTANFNKGGENKALLNGMYLFYNAGVAGNTVLVRGLKSQKVQMLVAGLIMAGFTGDLINRLMSGDDDDNGIKDYDQIPDYELETNIILWDWLGIGDRLSFGTIETPFGEMGYTGKYFKLPMPWGFNAFHNTGRNLSNMFSGSPIHNPGKSLSSIVMTGMDALNPLGGANSFLNFIAPTILDPIVDLWSNLDFAGNDVVPKDNGFGPEVPQSQRYWSNTGEVPKAVADHINRLTGGNEARKGAVDWSPEVYQYWFDYVTGAVGKTATRAFSLGESVVKQDFTDVTINNAPMARVFMGSVTNRANTGVYYDNKNEIETVANELKIFADSGKEAEYNQVLNDKPVEVGMIAFFAKQERPGGQGEAPTLADMRKYVRDLRANETMDDKEKTALIKQIQDQMDMVMAAMNKAYFEAKGFKAP